MAACTETSECLFHRHALLLHTLATEQLMTVGMAKYTVGLAKLVSLHSPPDWDAALEALEAEALSNATDGAAGVAEAMYSGFPSVSGADQEEAEAAQQYNEDWWSERWEEKVSKAERAAEENGVVVIEADQEDVEYKLLLEAQEMSAEDNAGDTEVDSSGDEDYTQSLGNVPFLSLIHI